MVIMCYYIHIKALEENKMVDFNEYKERKKKEEKNRRAALLDEMANIDTDLIETPIPESNGKVNYELTEKRREEEIQKLTSVSSRMNDESKSIREKWEKEGFNLFGEDDDWEG